MNIEHLMKMDEISPSTGEGAGGGSAEPTPATEASPAPDASSQDKGDDNPSAASEGEEGKIEGADKPFLGEEKKDEGQSAENNKDGDPQKVSDEDYLGAVVKDEKLLGNDSRLQLSKDLVKSVIPTARELGISPAALNKLANALAKAQVDDARDQMHNRIDYFEKMKNESIKRYSQKDFEQINAGIDKWFKPNGVMNNVIRNSELGADPEFLALMHHLGMATKQDGLHGAGDGGGGLSVDPNSTDGLAKIWK